MFNHSVILKNVLANLSVVLLASASFAIDFSSFSKGRSFCTHASQEFQKKEADSKRKEETWGQNLLDNLDWPRPKQCAPLWMSKDPWQTSQFFRVTPRVQFLQGIGFVGCVGIATLASIFSSRYFQHSPHHPMYWGPL